MDSQVSRREGVVEETLRKKWLRMGMEGYLLSTEAQLQTSPWTILREREGSGGQGEQ